MELRPLTLCLAVFVLAIGSQCSEGHTVQRRASDYSEEVQNDESSDYGAQNDADGGNDAEDEEPETNCVITTKPDTYKILIGRSVRLECQVEPAENAVISWSKGDEEKLFIDKFNIKQMDKYMLAPGSSDLIIKDLNFNDTGRYTCKVEQKKPVNITHVVIVEEPPRITNPETTTVDSIEFDNDSPRIVKFSASDNGQVHEGSSLLLTCEVTGTPKPSTLWSRQRRDGYGTEPLTEANGEFSGTTFFMRNVTRDDSGLYYCYAVSDAGNDTSFLEVAVSGKPRVYVTKTVINTDIGVEAILECSTQDEPLAHRIHWYKDNRLVENTDQSSYTVSTDQSSNGAISTLTVIPRTDDDFGTFTCEATNMHGTHSKSIELVQRPVVESLNVEGLKLYWTVHSHQPLEEVEIHLRQLGEEAEWKTYAVPLPETKSKEYRFFYVLNDDSLREGNYEATVKVRNDKDWSRHSEPVIVKLESVAQSIQTASVVSSPTGDAHSIRPAAFVLHTIMMYLLVRML